MNLASLLNVTEAPADDVIDNLRRRIAAYSEDQPRDKDGKWSKGDDDPLIKPEDIEKAITKVNDKESLHPHVQPAHMKEADDAFDKFVKAKVQKITLYHGTADDVETSILKDGIIPAKSPAGDEWARKNMGVDLSQGREISAFATTSKSQAAKYAGLASEMRHAEPVVFKLVMPKAEFDAHFVGDEQQYEIGFRSKEPIPAKWIVGVAKGTVVEHSVADPFFMQMPEVRLAPFRSTHPRTKKVTAAGDVTLYFVIAADGAKNVEAYSADQPRDKDGKWSEGGGEDLFVSPNAEENLSLATALKHLHGDLQTRFEAKARSIVGRAGVVRGAVGVWADGAEHSTSIHLNASDQARGRYIGALLGKIAEQKAVLTFTAHPKGTQALYKLHSEEPVDKIDAKLSAAGVPFRTIVPNEGGMNTAIIYDEDGSLHDKVAGLARSNGYLADIVHGTGSFDGSWTSREEGKAAYDKIIQDYESAHPEKAYKGGLNFSGQDQRARNGSDSGSEATKEIAAFNPDEARDKTGKWTDDGGSDYKPGDVAKFKELKSQLAQINTSLLPYVDNPTAPEVQQKMDEMRSVVKEISQLHADSGVFEDTRLPGGPRDLLIVGAGPGGLTSAVMGAADGLDTMVIESQPNVGGQSKFSSRIENYPGFPMGVSGTKLASTMYDQATRLGAEVKTGTTAVGLSFDPATDFKTVTLDNGQKIQARAVVLAGGVVFKKLDFPGSDSPDVIYGNGQMLRDNYAGKPVVVLGGSNGAAQAALGAALTASKVYLLSRSSLDKSMSDYQVEAVRNHRNIQVIENDQISRAFCDDQNRVLSVSTSKGLTLPAAAVGVFVGSAPKTDWLPKEVATEDGRIKTDGDLQTGVPGVFAIGDIRAGAIGRVGAAVGDGQMAERNAFMYFDKVKKAHASKLAASADDRTLQLIDALFDLDKANPYPLIQSVPKQQKKIKAFSPDEARDKDGKWTDGGDSEDVNYAKHLVFPLPKTDAAFRSAMQDSVNSLMQKYANDESKTEYKEPQIDAWMQDYNGLRKAGAPEDKATLQAAAAGKGVYPEAAAAAGLVPLQVKFVQNDIERWTADDFASFRDASQKVVEGATDADPAMVLEYAHTQAALRDRLTKRQQSPDAVQLYRGVSLSRDGFNNQVAALKTLINTPNWSVTWKVAGADSWTPDKYKAYQYKGDDGLLLGEKIPTAHVVTAAVANPFSFRSQPTEQEYIVAHPKGIMQLSKTNTEITAGLSEVLQAVSTLRAAGWKVTVDGKNISLEEPHPNPGWLHKKPAKSDVEAGRALDDKYEFQGLPISVETKKGNSRSGMKPDGTPWSVIMPHDYGYIRGTMGVDGDHVDCFIGPMKDAKFAYIIHQTKIGSDNYDEDKCMLGFPSANLAKKAYSSAYDDGKGTMHSMTMLPMSTFIAKVMQTKDRPSKIHAGGGMKIVASVDWKTADDRASVELWLQAHGFISATRNTASVTGDNVWQKMAARVCQTVVAKPDGSWRHYSGEFSFGKDLGVTSKFALTARQRVALKRGTAALLMKQRSLGITTGIGQHEVGRGRGVDMLKRHMREGINA